MHLRLTALLALSACHRVFGLDVAQDAYVDDTEVEPLDFPPTPTGWGAPVQEQLTLVFGDDDISLTSDLRTLFMNRLEGADGQIYTATRSSVGDAFPPPVIEPVLSAAGSQGTPRVMPDGLEILYHTDDVVASSELHRATRANTSAEWIPNGAVPGLNSPLADQNATMDADTMTMIVFASEREGGAGLFDLYYATRATPDDPWSRPDPISKLNTPEIETGPWLTRDGLELYFQRGATGVQQDIYVSRRSSVDAPFDLPVPVVEINTPDTYEMDAWVSPDGGYLYFVRADYTAMSTKLMYAKRE